MFHVNCPQCGAQIEIPSNAVGPDRTDPWNVTACIDCDLTFDYDDHQVIAEEQPIARSEPRHCGTRQRHK